VLGLDKLDLSDSRRVMEWLRGLALLAPGVMVAEPGDVVPDGSVVVMAANRLTDPGSMLYVSQWYPRTALPQLLGVRPEDMYDERLCRAMDRLVGAQAAVERAVCARLGEVGQDLKVVLYDMTSTCFCGRESELVRHGYSRDHRKDRPQITVGMVTTMDGFPVAHRVYPGNTVDVSTVFRPQALTPQSRPCASGATQSWRRWKPGSGASRSSNPAPSEPAGRRTRKSPHPSHQGIPLCGPSLAYPRNEIAHLHLGKENTWGGQKKCPAGSWPGRAE